MSKSPRFTLDQLRPGLQEQAVAVLHGSIGQSATPRPAPPPVAMPTPANCTTAKGRLRQDTKGQNRTEREFSVWLALNHPTETHHPQALTLKLGNGVRYTPDFAGFDVAGRLTCHETKGFMRDDAAVKIKVAAHIYPQITFILVTKRPKKRGGGWDMQRVLP